MFHYRDSSEDDAESYCTHVSAALEAKLAFGQEDAEEEAGRRGGAKVYSTFYVDSCSDEDYIDGCDFSSSLPSDFCPALEPASVCQQATPTKYEVLPSAAGNEVVGGVSTLNEDYDDGWNSDPGEDAPPLYTPSSSSGECSNLSSQSQ